MEEEEYQKELFEFEQPKKSFSRFADMLPKADFEGRVAITVSLEKIVFVSIGIVMVMVWPTDNAGEPLSVPTTLKLHTW